MFLYPSTCVSSYPCLNIDRRCCFLQSWSTFPGSALCSALTCRLVWTGRSSLWPLTPQTSCCLRKWQSMTACCRYFYTNWGNRTFGWGQEKSFDVSISMLSDGELAHFQKTIAEEMSPAVNSGFESKSKFNLHKALWVRATTRVCQLLLGPHHWSSPVDWER